MISAKSETTMGGLGSGRHLRWGTRGTTEGYHAIDVRRWAREGLLEPGRTFAWAWYCNDEKLADIRARVEHGCVFLIYRHQSYGDEWQEENYPVHLTSTPCHLGGYRQWFTCPARGCGRRVAKLYGGAIFACRHCYRLAYPSQREGYHERASRMAERIRDKLGWVPGTANGHGPKPKGMHWRTFHRLAHRHDTLDVASWAAFHAKFGQYL